jgi:outer membrane protein W
MQTKSRWSLLIAPAFIGASGLAMAEDGMGNQGRFFGKLYGGPSLLGNQKIQQTGVAAAGATSDASFDTGYAFGGAAGYYFTENLATELAWDYRNNSLDKADFGGGTNFAEGDYASNIFFLNGYYHFNPVMASKFRPYLGAGIGFVEEIDIDLKAAGGAETSYSQSGKIAPQLIAGTSYALSKDWDLNADVRYMKVSGIDFKDEKGGVAKLKNVDYDPVTLTVGITYKF